VLYLSSSVYALDDTDEWWRKIDPALGIETVVRTRVPNPPIFDAHFNGSREKEFILYQWETATCNVNFMGICLWHGGGNRWKRVRGISSQGGEITGKGDVDCQARVILTSWYKNDAQTWVQARSNTVSYIPYKPNVPPSEKSIGVVAGFADDSGGYGTVEFIYGCTP
jgi:hypothetical protein